jgi:hypothetical protein
VQFSTYNSGVEILGTQKIVKVGDRVELITMNDTWTKLEKGSKGIVFKIEKEEDDEALIWVEWDNGEKLALLNGIDKFKIIKK